VHPSSALTQTLCWLELIAALALALKLDGGALLRQALGMAAGSIPGHTARTRALVLLHATIAVASLAYFARAALQAA
jgi:hypothetical protein